MDSPLIKVFGESPFVKIVETLLDHPNYEYTKSELAEVNDISTQTLYRHWDKIEKLEIVTPTRKVGNSQMYKLNEENELVKRIYQFDQQLREHEEVQNLICG